MAHLPVPTELARELPLVFLAKIGISDRHSIAGYVSETFGSTSWKLSTPSMWDSPLSMADMDTAACFIPFSARLGWLNLQDTPVASTEVERHARHLLRSQTARRTSIQPLY